MTDAPRPHDLETLESLALASLREDPKVRQLLSDGYEAYHNLQGAAALARTPEHFAARTFAWDDWDRALRACVRELGAALLAACIERAATPEAHASLLSSAPPPLPPKASNDPEASHEPKAPSTTKAPNEPKASREPEASEASNEPETPNEPEAPSAREVVPSASALPEPASQLQLQTFKARFSDKLRDGSLASPPSAPKEKLAARKKLNEARALLDKPDAWSVMLALDRWADMDELRGAALWGPEEMQAWLEALLAMAQFVRATQPELAKGAKVWCNVNMTQQQQRLPFLYGLARKHPPRHGSWLDDAHERLEDLRALVEGATLETPREMGAAEAQREVEALLERWEEAMEDPALPCVNLSREVMSLLRRGMRPNPCILRWLSGLEGQLTGSDLSPLRDKIRQQRKEDEAEAVQSVERLPSDWAYWSLVRGRSAVVVGSEGKATHLDAILRAFEFSAIEHVPARDGERQAQALASSIKRGDQRVFLMMHRHMSHKLSNRIWDNKGRAFIYGVETGFGVTAVRLAIEKHGPAYLKRLAEQES